MNYEPLRIDWAEFRKHKEWLATIAYTHFHRTGDELEEAEGLLSFLDQFQDEMENAGLYRPDTTYQPEEQP